MLSHKLFFILLALLLIDGSLWAQKTESEGTGKISGIILDSISGKGIDYASISLSRQEDGKTVNGCTTDEKGAFELTKITDGTYKILIYFMGYGTCTKGNLVINPKNQTITLGVIKLSSKLTSLKEVSVSAEKGVIENKIDKMVYNVEKDLTSQGGVASDVLKKIPQVDVDVDGNVELQGNSNIRFLINGKPSSIFGNNLADVLASIPASQIQSIEVITSPGAKYDAEGTGGIINIILKKSKAQGFNGNISLTGGTRLENMSANLTMRKGNFGAHAFFSGNAQLLSSPLINSNRESQDPVTGQYSSLVQNGTSDFTRNGYQTGIGFDWDLNSKNTLSGSLSYNSFNRVNTGIYNRQFIQPNASGTKDTTINDVLRTPGIYQNQSVDWSLDYKKTFEQKDREFELLYVSSIGNNYAYYGQKQIYLTPESLLYNSSYGKNKGIDYETNISADYTQPISETALFETGVKTVLSHINSNSDVYLENLASDDYEYNLPQSSSLTYNRNVYAAYLSATFKLLKRFDVKMGCRDEYTQTSASFSDAGTVNISPYNSVVPSFVISRTFQTNQTIKLSYSHRIQRPDYGDLDPFLNASDPKNITTGNPDLKPEQSDKIELGYTKVYEKGPTINVVLFYRGNKDDIQSFMTYYPTLQIGDSIYKGVTLSTRENIGREDNYGANFYVSVPAGKKITLRSNVSLFQRYITLGNLPGQNISGFNYRINLNAAYELNHSMSIELFGNFNSPRINAQGTMPAFTTYNFAFRRQLFHKTASIALTATNPFNEYISQKTVLTGTDFTLISTRQLPYRSFGINFTYKFGKMEFKKIKEEEDPNLTTPPN